MLNDTSIFSIIEQADYPIVPWKNGLGQTRDIASLTDKQGLRYRISQASVVENGLFSDFRGLHRTLVLLSGHGLDMTHQSELGMQYVQLTKILEMAQFSGGDQTFASLTEGPIEDLNIMVRESDTKAEVSACYTSQPFKISNNHDSLLTAFYANQPCQISVDGNVTLTLETNHCLMIKQSRVLCLIKGSGVFINITDKSTKVT